MNRASGALPATGRPAGSPVKPEDSVPAAIGSKVPGEHQEPEEGYVGSVQEPEHPDLRVKDVARPGPPHLVDDAFSSRGQKVRRPPPGAYGARLAEDVDASALGAQRLHYFDGVLLLIEPKARERERGHQGRG